MKNQDFAKSSTSQLLSPQDFAQRRGRGEGYVWGGHSRPPRCQKREQAMNVCTTAPGLHVFDFSHPVQHLADFPCALPISPCNSPIPRWHRTCSSVSRNCPAGRFVLITSVTSAADALQARPSPCTRERVSDQEKGLTLWDAVASLAYQSPFPPTSAVWTLEDGRSSTACASST